MPYHLRKQIGDAHAALVTGLPTTGGRVFRARTKPFAASELPSRNIRVTKDDLIDRAVGNRMTRAVTVLEEIRAKLVDGFEDVVNEAAKESEVAVMASPTLGGLLTSYVLNGTTITSGSATDQDVVLLTMEWLGEYRHFATDPTATIT